MSRQPTGTTVTRPFRARETRRQPRCGVPEHRGYRRSSLLPWLTVILLPALAHAAPGYRDPEFSRFPFAQWLTENRTQIHWSVMVSPAQLSTHQRLILRITLRVDGKELEKRRSAGAFEGLIEYADTAGHVWQNHLSVDPAKLQAAMQRQYLDIHFYAFVLPGDYTVSLGVCDPKTFEHSVSVRKVHVPPLKTEPLPDLWAGLPPVDIISGTIEPPDVWYLPEVDTRLNLPVETKRPLHVQLLLNTTPSQKAAGSVSAMRDNMSVLIPALKVLSQMRLGNGAVDVAMLDLTHRKVAFEQKSAAPLAWDSIRRFFLDTHPGIIDVRTLEGQHKMLPFFRNEVKQRLAASQVVIVLSGPAFLEDQEAVDEALEPAYPDHQLFYIRYRTVPALRRYPQGMQAPNRFTRFPVVALAPPDPEALIPPMVEDDLEKTAEPLNARVFDAASAQQFRRVLAAVIEQMSHL